MRTEGVSFLNDGQRIDGTLVLPYSTNNAVSGVIFFAGMTSDKSGYISYAEALAKAGIAGLAISTRARGQSEGDFNTLTLWDRVSDGFAAYDYLRTCSGVDGTRIGLCGASVGAAMASIISSKRDVKSLLLRAPATYTEEMMQMTLAQTMKNELTMFKELDNIADTPPIRAIKQFRGDLLLVISGKDSIIPAEIPQAYANEATEAHKVRSVTFNQAVHAPLTEEQKGRLSEILVRWFKDTL